MRTFNLLAFVLILGSVQSLYSQDLPLNIQRRMEIADSYFLDNNFKKAVEEYLTIDAKQDLLSVKIKIAQVYQKMGQFSKALEWYESVENDSSFSIEHKYEYAKVLLANGDYEKAKDRFEKSGHPLANGYLTSLGKMGQLFEDSSYFTIDPLPINSSASEFSPAFFEDGILYVAGDEREGSEAKQFNIWYLPIPEKGEKWKKPIELNQSVNSAMGEGPMSYHESTNSLYFTRTTNEKPEIIEDEKVYPLGIYTATKTTDDFDKAELVDFNGKKGSFGHPAINRNGDQLYFISDMEGSIGGTDIWVASLKKGKWTNFKNLGKKFNSEGDELFPYIYQDSLLFFASNGHGGMGELDIFMINLNTNEMSNMGAPINSPYDDFGYIMRDRYFGFFTSNRPGGAGTDDIYAFQYLKVNMKGLVVNEEGNALSDIQVKLISDRRGENRLITSQNGEFISPLAIGVSYRLEVVKEGYHSHIQEVLVTDPIDYEVTIVLPKLEVSQVPLVVKEPISQKVYKVQIGADVVPLNRRDLEERGYKGQLDVHYYRENEWHKYAIGTFDSFEEAQELKKSCEVFDAFIVVFDKEIKVASEFTIN